MPYLPASSKLIGLPDEAIASGMRGCWYERSCKRICLNFQKWPS